MNDNAFAPPLTDSTNYSDDAPLAGLGERFMARVADVVLVFAAFLPSLVLMAIGGGPDHIEQENPVLMVIISLFALFALLGLTVYQWYLLHSQGQTVGKQLMGIQIVKLDGSPVTFLEAVILRIWVLGVPTAIMNQCCLGWVVSLIDVLLIFGEERRCGHDYIAGTKVITLDPSAED